MKNSWLDKLIRYGKAHLTQKHWKGILAVLACAAVLCTMYALIAPAKTMAEDTAASAATSTATSAAAAEQPQVPSGSSTSTVPAGTGDTRPVITVTTDNSKSHGNLTFYTGEAATTTLTISNPESAQITEDDGTVVRVYMEFAKTNPGEGHPASADGAPSQAVGTYTVVSNTGKSYAYTVTRIDGTDKDHYTYCMEFQRPLQGDTISISLPSGYPSPTSAGGTNTVWGVVLTKEEKEALDADGKTGIAPKPENGENTQTITWETKADDFALKKEHYTSSDSLLSIKSDGNGGYYVDNLRYTIRTSRSTTQTLEGQGKDYVAAVAYTDTFTLPEGVNFSQDVIDAIKSNNLTYSYWNSNIFGRYSGTVTGASLDIKSTGKSILRLRGFNPGSKDEGTMKISLSDNARTITISWTSNNGQTVSNSAVTANATEHGYTQFDLLFGENKVLVIPKLNEAGTYTFNNTVSSDWHYCWSIDRKKDASCKATVSAGEAKFEMSKDERNSGVFGSPTEYWIYLSNKGTLPYEKLCYVKDPLPDTIYLTADGMEKLFTDKNHFGKGASILISDATFCPDGTQHQTVTGIDGKTTGTTAARNTSADSDGKYSGCSNSKQHPEDHTGIIDIRWNQDHTNLVLSFTKADGSTSTRTCAADAASIQAALDAEHYLVTNFTHYTVEWDLRDENGKPRTIYGGQSIAIPIYARSKDTFMRLEQDWPGSYPKSHVYAGNNTAYAYGTGMSEQQEKDKLASALSYNYEESREFYLSKDATLADGKTMTEKHVPKDDETVGYRLSVKHISADNYDILPLTDHMSGAQVLLAEVAKNKTAAWASGCEVYTAADGTQYYKLDRAGTYSGVWLGDKYADSVTVTKNASGRDTFIKWYFTNYAGSRTDTVSYKALVCPKELKIEGLTYSLNNESWLGDHQTHRLYATIGEIHGSMLKFNKKIVSENDVQAANDIKAEGEDYCPVSDGQTVYYRFMFKAEATEAEEGGQIEPSTVTLTGNQLRDALPLGLSKDGTNYLKWKKGTKDAAHAQPGDVWIVGYQNATNIQGEDNWNISDTKTENQQEIHWNKNFSVSFTSEHPLYVYVRLTFPKGADWQEYAAQYGSTELVNTLYVDGVPDSVTHDLKTQAKAILQKGVYSSTGGKMQTWPYSVVYVNKRKDSLFYYLNNDAVKRWVCYSVILYNGGNTRLYINDMQDVLPRGFTFGGFYYKERSRYYSEASGDRNGSTCWSAYYSSFSPNSETNIQYKLLSINTDVQNRDGVQLLTFHFTKESTGSNADLMPNYDEKRGKYYLNPGEAINFAYYAFTNERKDTDDAAVNSIAMPYYDYTNGGLCVGNTMFHRGNMLDTYYSGCTPNDGSCAVIDNTQAVASGRTGVSDDTQWLYSQVKQVRGEIKPGITKKLTAAVKTDGTVVKDPLAAHPTDTLRWSVNAANDGNYPLYDYVLSDTMQEPYQFDGKVSYTIYNAYHNVYGNYNLFSISAPDADGKAELTCYKGSSTDKFSLTVNGKPLECQIYGSPFFKYQVRLTKDAQTGRYTLSIRFPDKVCAIPAGGTGVLTLETKRTDNRLVNTVFTNTCFITPMEQTWDNTTNKGNMTTLNDVFGEDNKPSVRNSAPVTTAYGYVTSSRKSVEEKEKPSNKASCDTSPNYIVLPKKDSVFTYTLSVDAPEKAMDKLVLIDGLPETGDHSSFQNDDPRYSEFKVGLANNPHVTVTVTDEDGSVRTLTYDQFTVEYSTKTEFDSSDWKGDSAWNSGPASARSLRIKILDESGKLIPSKSHVSVRFDANIEGDASAGQIAWNSFGYNYSVVSDPSELEAAPLKVGVMIPTAPEMEKTVVDSSGTPAAVSTDKTFRFLLYTGTSLKEKDEAKLAAALTANSRKAALVELTVKAGKHASDQLKLDHLKVCQYENGQWTQTDTDWTWENGKSYTIVELPGDDPAYAFGSINNNAAADGFQFTYKNDQATVLSAVNTLNTWDFTIHKTDAESGSALGDAWFALYSPDPSDRMTEDAYDALADKPKSRPDFTLTTGEGENAKTWYLTRIGRTQGEDGTLVWDNLLRDEYRYKEIQAPKGYKLDSTIRTATKTDLTHETTIENKSLRIGASVHPPEMGGAGTGWFLMGGVLLLAAGLLVYGLKRKKETR